MCVCVCQNDSPLVNLSLRYCGITALGAKYLGESLGSATQQNTRLQSLDLAGNKISDSGATYLANGLRLNRTLLVLNLAANSVGDVGATQLAVVLSTFELTHDEVVERRRLRRIQRVRARSRQLSRSKLSARRSLSSQAVGHQRGRKRVGGSPAERSDHGKTGKQAGKTAKSPRAAQADDGKPKKEKTGTKTKKTASPHGGRGQESSETSHAQDKSLASDREAHPLLSVDVLRQSSVEQPTTLVRGNRTLISLNLSRNEIGQVGMTALLNAVLALSAVPADPLMPGLLRITTHHNRAYRTPAGSVTHARWSTASVGVDTGREVDTIAGSLAVAISTRDPVLRHSGPNTSKLVPTTSNTNISFIEA